MQPHEKVTWDLDPDTTLLRLLAANAQAFPAGVAFREKDRGIWQQVTWGEAYETVLRMAAGLQASGLAAEQGVAAPAAA